MKIALTGLPGSGKTSLFNAIAQQPVDLLPGVPGAPPHVSTLLLRDERLDWLCGHYEPKKCTPVHFTVEDHGGIPPGFARSDRRGALFGQMRTTDGLVLVVRAFGEDADPARDLELIALELASADSEICERRLHKLEEEWKNPRERDRVERERHVVGALAAALGEGRGAHSVELKGEEELFVRGFGLLTRKPAVLVVNTAEGAPASELDYGALPIMHEFDRCLSLEADLADLDGDERELFAAEYGVTEPLKDRFAMACYHGLGLVSFFTVSEEEVKAWTIRAGDDALTAAGKVHTDLARGFIRAEVTPFEELRALGSMREVKAKGKQRLEGKDYTVEDGDILQIRFSV